MRDSYHTLRTAGEAEIVERRSRFLGAAWPVTTEEAVQRHLEERKRAHREARHHVYAYRLRAGMTERCTDDGEPQGSAGVPVLKVLQGEELLDCLVVVTRYFGGTLLGTGGLARAYAQAAKAAVTAAGRLQMAMYRPACIRCAYAAYGWIEPLIREGGGVIDDTRYDDGVTIRCRMPDDRYAAFVQAVTDRSAGTVNVEGSQALFCPVHAAE